MQSGGEMSFLVAAVARRKVMGAVRRKEVAEARRKVSQREVSRTEEVEEREEREEGWGRVSWDERKGERNREEGA